MVEPKTEEADVTLENEEEEIEQTDEIPENRTIADVILGNHLPSKPLGAAIIGFVILFEIFLGIAGFYLGKNYTLAYSVPFLLIPIFWGWVFSSRAIFRASIKIQRSLQALMLGYFSDSVIYFCQWFAVYGMITIILKVYQLSGTSATVLFFGAVWEVLFEAIFLEAIPEELLKFGILYNISRVESLPSKYAAINYTAFASMGFIFFSGTLRILRVYWMSGIYLAIFYFFVEAFLTSTMQIVAGVWIGLNFIKKQFRDPSKSPVPTWRVVLPSIVLHACFMSLISVSYFLFYVGYLDWKLMGLICIIALVFILIALFLSFKQVKNVVSDPNFYVVLSTEEEITEEEMEQV